MTSTDERTREDFLLRLKKSCPGELLNLVHMLDISEVVEFMEASYKLSDLRTFDLCAARLNLEQRRGFSSTYNVRSVNIPPIFGNLDSAKMLTFEERADLETSSCCKKWSIDKTNEKMLTLKSLPIPGNDHPLYKKLTSISKSLYERAIECRVPDCICFANCNSQFPVIFLPLGALSRYFNFELHRLATKPTVNYA